MFSGFSGPVGSGKTYALAAKTIMAAWSNPGCTGVLAAPTFPMLRDTVQATLVGLIEEHRIPYEYKKSANAIVFPTIRSVVLLRSLEDYERLRGTNLAWFGIDELTYTKREAWERLEARIRDPKARRPMGFGVWTPNGFDWVYKRFVSVKDRLPGYDATLAAPFENKVVLAARPDYYEVLRGSYDPNFFAQEALGQYLAVGSGRVYHAYSDANEKPCTFNPHQKLLWAMDFNVDPMCSVIAQFYGGRLYVLDELFLRNADTPTMCARFQERIDAYRAAWQDTNGGMALPVNVYGDASGSSRHSSSSRTDYDLVRESFRGKAQFAPSFQYPSKNPAVKDRVNSVNALLHNAAGLRRTTVDPRCKELIVDFYEVSWKKGALNFELDQVTDKSRTHLSDALGYLIWQEARIDGFERKITTN